MLCSDFLFPQMHTPNPSAVISTVKFAQASAFTSLLTVKFEPRGRASCSSLALSFIFDVFFFGDGVAGAGAATGCPLDDEDLLDER